MLCWFCNYILGGDVTIFRGSRYEDSVVDFISTEADGDSYPVVFYEFSEPGLIEYSDHYYVEGERLDELAYKYYGRPSLWWYLLELNPQITDIFNIEPGTVIRIPRV